MEGILNFSGSIQCQNVALLLYIPPPILTPDVAPLIRLGPTITLLVR